MYVIIIENKKTKDRSLHIVDADNSKNAKIKAVKKEMKYQDTNYPDIGDIYNIFPIMSRKITGNMRISL